MSDDLYTVKSGMAKRESPSRKAAPSIPADPQPRSGKRSAYHHGALRDELIAAAEAVIRERGVDGFSLREAARRARVSAAAPQHHFGDARGLLTAVATVGFIGLGDALAAADAGSEADTAGSGRGETSRIARLRRQGSAYVAYALTEPARFDVMWRKARIDCENADYKGAAERAYGLLNDVIAGAGAAPKDTPWRPDPRTIAAWSLVHGFARLALDGAFGTSPEAAQAAAEAMLPGVIARLDV